MSRKMKYFGQVMGHSGLEGTAMEGMVSRGETKWTQNLEDSMAMRVHEAGRLVVS